MHKRTHPSTQGARRQGGSSPSYPERQSLPPFRDSVPNNYVPSVRKTAAAASSAQSQPPMYHPSQYDREPQTNHATMSPVAAAKHLVSSDDTLPSTVMLLLTKYFSMSRSTQVLVCFVSSPLVFATFYFHSSYYYLSSTSECAFASLSTPTTGSLASSWAPSNGSNP